MFRYDIENVTAELINKLIELHDQERYLTLQGYYEGQHVILDRQKDPHKPNNKLVNNFPGYITDVNVGYFLGKPVTYSTTDDGFSDDLREIFNYNDEQDENVELGKKCSINGHAPEIVFLDEESEIRFDVLDTPNVIFVYDTTVEERLILAIHYWLAYKPGADQGNLRATVYTENEYIEYAADGEDDLVEVERTSHVFGMVPVVEYLNNDERQSDFEKVLTLIDGYDKTTSDTANDFEDFTDAFLMLKNLSGTTGEDLEKIKKEKVIKVDGDGDAAWLIKEINDRAVENYKDRLSDDIHKFSKTPSLTDESFSGNVTGIALQYRLWGLEQNAAQKERKFKKGLQRRLQLICKALEVKGKSYDWREVQISFTRNIPAVLPELVQMARDLHGIVSKRTIHGVLPMVDDSDREEELLRAERENDGRVDFDSIPDEPEGEAGEQ